MARPLFESNLVIRGTRSSAGKKAEALGLNGLVRPAEGKKRRSNRKASDTGVVPAEGSLMPKEVKVGALHKVPMWDFVQAVVVATRVLEIRFGIWELRQKCVFLRHGRRRGCLGASRFVAGTARPQKCVFLRHGRRRGCLGASRFVAGTARFIMV
ncbi:hypothetical protein L3X38_004000 [Prunus dulcis]|uniref:Uncharacterized protein n=1 Tax=Prunus dulcis TaxID=3755 RepID=A0AAD5F2S8_PRUDU|nr:hypothetical protein L3X38_004000 [Prunus dulcis]